MPAADRVLWEAQIPLAHGRPQKRCLSGVRHNRKEPYSAPTCDL